MWRQICPVSKRISGIRSCVSHPKRFASGSSKNEETGVDRPLAFSLPDLQPHEVKYIQSQISLLRRFGTESVRKMGWAEAEAIVKEEFRHFLTGKKTKPSDRLYRHLIQSPVLAWRTVRALKVLKVPQEEIVENPAILSYPLISLPRDVEVSY